MDVQLPATYWIGMVFDANDWHPAEQLPMPHHHATRIELTNIDEFPWLRSHRGKHLRFTVELMSREIRRVPGRDEWRATYHARIVSVCIP